MVWLLLDGLRYGATNANFGQSSDYSNYQTISLTEMRTPGNKNG